MKEIEELTIYSFEKELKDMAVSCIGLKENTAKSKVSKIITKYEEIISHSKRDKDYIMEKFHRYRTLFDTLKSGRIYYETNDLEGYLLIRDIEQIEVSKKNVVVTLKTGREIKFSTDFEYLSEIL
jgi:hypothetical protein